VRRPDDDVGDGRRHAHLDAAVALLGQLALEELVELGIEDAVGDELPALRTEGREYFGQPCFSPINSRENLDDEPNFAWPVSTRSPKLIQDTTEELQEDAPGLRQM
jgi:hypothetical protein